MRAVVCIGLMAIAVGAAAVAAEPAASDKQWETCVDKAIDFLKSSQEPNGGWSTKRSPGVTGVVLTGVLATGKVNPETPVASKALGYIESLVNAEEKHIAGRAPQVQLKNYVTSVNVMALSAANREGKYRKIIGDAGVFLKQLQWDEEEGKQKGSDFYGGAGYDSKSRPDLSNTQFFLEALKSAGIPESDPAFQKANVFVSRCQNLKGEHNDQPWAGEINDGSFIYSAAGGGSTKVDGPYRHGFPGYGSMTYAGIKSMIYCGVTRDDPRVKKAYEWIQKNYTVDANPGMPPVFAHRGLYYYYHTMAKCLDLLGIDEVVDANGVKHNWRADLIAALAKRQQPNGSWINDRDQWMEGDPNLVTGYALMALSHCRKK